jgi:hypothetical protein
MVGVDIAVQLALLEICEVVPFFVLFLVYYGFARYLLHSWWMNGATAQQLAKARSWLITLALSSLLSIAGVYYTLYCVRTWATQWPKGIFSMDFNLDHISEWSSVLDSRFCAQVSTRCVV